VIKLWAWLIISSQKPLTKVSGYRRCILGIIINNFVPGKKEETYSDSKKHPGYMQLELLMKWLWASKAIMFFTPAPSFVLQMAVGSGIRDCTRIAHLIGCRLHDRLQEVKHTQLAITKIPFLSTEQSEPFKDSDNTLILPDSHSDWVSLRSLLSPTNWQMEKRRHPLWQAYRASSYNINKQATKKYQFRLERCYCCSNYRTLQTKATMHKLLIRQTNKWLKMSFAFLCS